jgi:mRNA interferase MazF
MPVRISASIRSIERSINSFGVAIQIRPSCVAIGNPLSAASRLTFCASRSLTIVRASVSSRIRRSNITEVRKVPCNPGQAEPQTAHLQGSKQAGLRPVLVVSDDFFNRHSGTVIAFAITGSEPKAGYPLSIRIESLKMPKASWVKLSQIRTLSIQRLAGRLGRINENELQMALAGFDEIVNN